MGRVRIAQTATETLTHVFYVDGQPTDATGTVTVAVTRAVDGSAVASGNASHTAGQTGVYTYTLPAQANLDLLAVAWTGTVGGGPVTAIDYAEVVAGFFFPISDMWAPPYTLDPNKYSAATLAEKRTEVEDECERICGWSFVPRFAYEHLVGSGNPYLHTSHYQLRRLRAVTVNGTAWSTTDVTGVLPRVHGVLYRPGGVIWPAGADILAEYEHGFDLPPGEIVYNAKRRLRSVLTGPSSGIPDRASSFTTDAGNTYRLTLPDEDSTGIPDVDAAYRRWGRKRRKRAVFA